MISSPNPHDPQSNFSGPNALARDIAAGVVWAEPDADDFWDDDWDVREAAVDDAGWEVEATPIFDALAAAVFHPSFGLELDWNAQAREDEIRGWQSAGFGWE